VTVFVLVPGAMHGSWCWQPVRELLESSRCLVATPALTGMGERADELTADVGLDDHVSDVVSAAGDAERVVAVFHSYSGVLAGPVAERLGDRLSAVILLGAFIAHRGESLLDVEPPESQEAFLRLADEQGDGIKVPFQESFLERWGVSDPELAQLLRDQLTPMPLKCTTDKAQFDPQALENVRRIYVDHQRPQPDPFTKSVQRAKAEGWEMKRIETTHDMMLTEPKLTAELILDSCD